MARYNKIFAGPVTEVTPQVQEAQAAEALVPGRLCSFNAGKFEYADAAGVGKLFVVQDNYLQMKGVEVAWAIDERAIAMEMLDEQFFNLVVPTGNSVVKGAPLELANDGKLTVAAGAGRIVAYAEETYNNNTGSDQLVRARVAKGFSNAA